MFSTFSPEEYGLYNPPAIVREPEGRRSPTEDGTEEQGFDFENWVVAARQRIERLLVRAEEDETLQLDDAVEHLEKLENELKRVRVQLQLTLGRAAQLRDQVNQMSSGIRTTLDEDLAQVEVSVMEILSPVETVLRAYRDGRWNLMAVQAKREPEGDAPIFEDPEALLAYLEG